MSARINKMIELLKIGTMKLIVFQLILDVICLILFGIFAWIDKSVGYMVACMWVIIAMISHIDIFLKDF
jgi:hypothetical protein